MHYYRNLFNNGYYPYYLEYRDKGRFYLTLEQNIHTTLESDLPAIHTSLNGATIRRIEKLLSIISSLVPFTPDMNSDSPQAKDNPGRVTTPSGENRHSAATLLIFLVFAFVFGLMVKVVGRKVKFIAMNGLDKMRARKFISLTPAAIRSSLDELNNRLREATAVLAGGDSA